jgi:hypothetical protein
MNALNLSQIVNSRALRDRLILCPEGCTPAQIAAFTRVQFGARQNFTIPDRVRSCTTPTRATTSTST